MNRMKLWIGLLLILPWPEALLGLAALVWSYLR